jgi:hypothetical protein
MHDPKRARVFRPSPLSKPTGLRGGGGGGGDRDPYEAFTLCVYWKHMNNTGDYIAKSREME